MSSIYLNIGSNKGDRHANIERAVALILGHPQFAEARMRRAPFVYSNPVGYASDSEFMNLGLALDFATDKVPIEPLQVLDITQEIERIVAPDSPHRNPDGSYRDRIVDIDIIAIDGVVLESDRLVLPHPRAEARDFVMQPMAFLAPEWHPSASQARREGFGKKTIADMNRDSLQAFKAKKKLPVVVVLDNIRSLNNIGSIFRTSDAFCISGIALCGITATPPAPEIHKTALGAEESVDWRHYDSTIEAINSLRREGYTILCLEQVHNSVSLEQFTPKSDTKYALIVGNEVSGVEQRIVDMADVCIEIPQAGTKHSLNVAVSAAVALWHLFYNLKS